MGEIEVNQSQKEVWIYSDIFLYGDLGTDELAKQFGEEIETMWNEVEGSVHIENDYYRLRFQIHSKYDPNINAEIISANKNPRNNYFRVEDFSPLNISWVDGVGSNTGYMLIDNLYLGSTTAAHEYGHTLGLDHPTDLILIGKGIPGLMYPRGTLVDPAYQYDPKKQPGEAGGTMHPMHRKVWDSEVKMLGLEDIIISGKNVIGKFTNIYHSKHIRPVES